MYASIHVTITYPLLCYFKLQHMHGFTAYLSFEFSCSKTRKFFTHSSFPNVLVHVVRIHVCKMPSQITLSSHPVVMLSLSPCFCGCVHPHLSTAAKVFSVKILLLQYICDILLIALIFNIPYLFISSSVTVLCVDLNSC